MPCNIAIKTVKEFELVKNHPSKKGGMLAVECPVSSAKMGEPSVA